mgnify:CR=1 FL=1
MIDPRGYEYNVPPDPVEPPTCLEHEREITTPGTDCDICQLEDRINWYIDQYGTGAAFHIINHMYAQGHLE